MRTNSKIITAIAVVALMALPACSPDVQQSPTAIPEATIGATPIQSQTTATEEPTANQAEPTVAVTTATSELFTTPTSTQETAQSTQCVDVVLDGGLPASIQGKVVAIDKTSGQAVVLAFPAAQITALFASPTQVQSAVLSPTGQRLVFHVGGEASGESEMLRVMEGSGAILSETPWRSNWIALAGWIDEKRLAIVAQDEGSSGTTLGYHFELFDPVLATVVGEVLPPSDVYSTPPLPDWQSWQPYIPDRSLEYAVYLQLVDGYQWAYSIWSYKENSALTSVKTFSNRFAPQWSPTDDKVAIAYSDVTGGSSIRDEIYLFDTTGAVSQVTQLHEEYPAAYIQSLNWSPRGDKIAFWLNSTMQAANEKSFGAQTLMLLDTTSGTTEDLCLQGDADTSPFYKLIAAPMWSTDGSYLIIENRLADSTTNLFVVDLTTRKAYEVGKQLSPLGWLAGP